MKWIIVAPRYSGHSAGCVFLHRLCYALNLLGRDARLVFLEGTGAKCQTLTLKGKDWTNPEWDTPPVSTFEDAKGAIVLYSETVLGNPLDADQVVRYFGNREGNCNGGSILLGKDDYEVAHSRVLRPSAKSILFHAHIDQVFTTKLVKPLSSNDRYLDCTYVGKGDMYGPVNILPNTTFIRRKWPTTRLELADLLRSTRFLHTWDAWSSMNVEAVLCGALPIIRRFDPWTPEDLAASEVTFPYVTPGHPGMTDDVFWIERARLVSQLQALEKTWPERVLDFSKDVEAHFGG